MGTERYFRFRLYTYIFRHNGDLLPSVRRDTSAPCINYTTQLLAPRNSLNWFVRCQHHAHAHDDRPSSSSPLSSVEICCRWRGFAFPLIPRARRPNLCDPSSDSFLLLGVGHGHGHGHGQLRQTCRRACYYIPPIAPNHRRLVVVLDAAAAAAAVPTLSGMRKQPATRRGNLCLE